MQDWHVLQASPSVVWFSQLMVLARIRAQVVLPTPLGPQNKKACASCWCLIAFLSVVVICDCPTTVSKVCGLYFRAETMNFSINKRSEAGVRNLTWITLHCCNNKESFGSGDAGFCTLLIRVYQCNTGCGLNSLVLSKR